MVPVHALATIDEVGAVSVDVRIVVVGAGGIVDTGPAVREGIGIGSGARQIVGFVLEVVEVGQLAERHTGGAAVGRFESAGIAGATDSAHANDIVRVRRQVGGGKEGVGGRIIGGVASAGHHNNPTRFLSGRDPREGDLVGRSFEGY